jgi:DNA-binding transcriptional LysR family regulator
MTPELRQMRYVTAVATERSFSRAAQSLHVAQQALSQQVRAVEDMLGVQLFERTNRGVTLTAAGETFVQEARRTLNAAERATRRTRAAAHGEVGTVRLAYTLATVYETLPVLVDTVAAEQSELRVLPAEAFGADVPGLLADERFDVALAPRAERVAGLEHRAIRREPFVAALPSRHRLAHRTRVPLDQLAGETFELWPREMAPGYYDAVVAACRGAGFEPVVDQLAAGNTVWRNIARFRGVGLVVASAGGQLPAGITVVRLVAPPTLTIDLVWPSDRAAPAVQQVLAVAGRLASDRGWI